MTTRARAIHLKHQQQPLLYKSRIQAPTGALRIRLVIRLFKIRLHSPIREHGKNVRLKIYTEISWTMYPQTNILNMQSLEDWTSFIIKERGRTLGRIWDSWDRTFPEIRGIFQMFQSRLKGCVCRAGMATMLIGGEFRMRGGYSTGTNAELNIWPKKSPPLSMNWQNWWWQGGHGAMP